MCYYARTDYSCGDFKWGNMKQRCEREHRMGEHCPAKLTDTNSQTYSREACRLCLDIATKERRLQKEQDNINRWTRDTKMNFKASIEKAERESHILKQQIEELVQRRPAVRLRGVRQGLAPLEPGWRHGDHGKGQRENDRHGGKHYPSSDNHGSSYSHGSNGGNRHAR